MSTDEPAQKRIASLDQFRGYTVLAMFLVNFLGSFEACHWLLRHHNVFCSFADTIMPQFLFAVGFAFRLSFQRRTESRGAPAAYARMVRRLLGLVLVSLVVYSAGSRAETWDQLSTMGAWEAVRGPLKSTWFQTLTHIAVTSLWVLPVVRAGAGWRIAFLLGSAAVHVVASHAFYFHWVNNGDPNGIDGGPLGFLTWAVPMIVGTLAYDAVAQPEGRRPLASMLLWSALLMAAGYALSCGTRFYDAPSAPQPAATKLASQPVIPTPAQVATAREKVASGQVLQLLAEPPFVPPPHPDGDIGKSHQLRAWNYWMMSQRSGTLSYQVFAAGFSLAVFLLFYVGCDLYGWRIGVLCTFGANALAAYVLHMMVDHSVKSFMPRDAPEWYMWGGCAVFIGVTYLLVRSLELRGIYLKL